MAFLLSAYFWVLTSGKEQFILDQAKALYQYVANWLDGADADFQLKETTSRKKSRRWD
jgi:hypothetical protein